MPMLQYLHHYLGSGDILMNLREDHSYLLCFHFKISSEGGNTATQATVEQKSIINYLAPDMSNKSPFQKSHPFSECDDALG
jgi:hypothetical protein